MTGSRAEDPSRAVQYEQAGKTGKTDIYLPDVLWTITIVLKYCEDDSMQQTSHSV